MKYRALAVLLCSCVHTAIFGCCSINRPVSSTYGSFTAIRHAPEAPDTDYTHSYEGPGIGYGLDSGDYGY